jgi:cobalamin biosynthesis Mg chelatase CobN
MNWIRHQATRGSGRSALLLSSVLALLALACFPIVAQADSSEVEYENALPKAEPNGPSHNEQIAESSDSPKNGGAEAPANTGSGASGEGSYTEGAPSSEGDGAANTGNDGGTGQGNPDKGSSPPAKAGLQPGAPIAESGTASDDGGGSSPLVPILIAVLALAAISIAAVMVRQRRQRDGSGPSSLSTKAG